jgi:hypothetical protein
MIGKHFQIALVLSLLFVIMPAIAKAATTSTVIPLPVGSSTFSMVAGPDGNIWFTNASVFPGNPVLGYLVRLAPNGTTTNFTLPAVAVPGGSKERTVAIALVDAPATPLTLGRRLIVFNWAAANAISGSIDESGLGTIDVDYPSNILEYAAENPGDPLYSPALTLESPAASIASGSNPPVIWSYAHTLPSTATSQELVAAVPFPFRAGSAVTAFPIASETTSEWYDFDAFANGADGNAWYQGQNAIGRANTAGTTEFAVPPSPITLAAANTNVWVSTVNGPDGHSGLYGLSYGGTTQAAYWGPYGDGVWLMATAPDALWSLRFNGASTIGSSRGNFAVFLRMANSGQWSVYPIPVPLTGSVPSNAATLAVARDGTIWGTLYSLSSQSRSVLVGLRADRVLSTTPTVLTLAVGQSASLSVTETNNAAPYFAGSVQSGCPVRVVRGPSFGTFKVTAIGSVPGSSFCQVTISDRGGPSVLVPVILPINPAANLPRVKTPPRFDPLSGLRHY